ncbi:Uma2 family endonuclease [Planctomyces sp. SH-PL14]|uniref:Uma2 family endonuclease n=1 Tax=Planctomyces sp. SH-PL14 TaxID=1632864 RepID=UPI00078B7993|nr:Uma2 family endonuclease [Planctomyces sp. SH-PL14]AMV22553.1 hypothetical protein VT03_31950 [Planctomyces sp. SH-PL14]
MAGEPLTTGTVFDVRASERTRPASARITMPVSEFQDAALYGEDVRYEVFNDLVVLCPATSPAERGPNGELEYLLRAYRDRHPLGGILDDTLADQELVTPAGLRRPDRVIWTELGRTPQIEFDPPSIVVEFVSITTVDRRREFETKRNEYGQLGVAEYWILDRFRRMMVVCRGDVVAAVVPEDGTYETPLLPGFSLPFRDLLKYADRYDPPASPDPA